MKVINVQGYIGKVCKNKTKNLMLYVQSFS